MRNVTSLVIVSAVLFFSQPVHADDSVGAGLAQCGEFLARIESDDWGAVDVALFTAWMQGYLTGKNIARAEADLPVLELAGHEGQFRYVKNYCEEHPLREVMFGVIRLWSELLKQQELE